MHNMVALRGSKLWAPRRETTQSKLQMVFFCKVAVVAAPDAVSG